MENEGQIYCHSEKRESPSEKSFTIIWEIENPRYFNNLIDKLYSPVVVVDVMERTGWRLVLYRLKPNMRTYVTIKREAEDNGPEQFDLYYHFDVTPIEEGELEDKSRFHAFIKDESGPPILLRKDEPKERNSYKLFRPHNITIKCNMKKKNGPISMSGQCVARTRIGGEHFEFIGKVENCTALSLGAKRTLKILSLSTGERLMTVDLRLDKNSHLFVIDIIPMVDKNYKYFFSSMILDCSGSEIDLRHCCEYALRKTETLSLGYENGYMKYYPEYILLNDTLSLVCEIAIQTGMKTEEIEKLEYEESAFEVANQNMSTLQNLGTPALAEASPCSFENDSKFQGSSQNSTNAAAKRKDNLRNRFPNVVDDFTAFYKKGILCDVKLQTATETFPTHKAILSARSPVFEAMFTSDMKEKIQECVRIDDVDAETVERMLLFLYSDCLEELKWEDAKKLYFPADKYQVISLKYKCAEILKKNIDLSNCCELLLLSDMHQDEDLKNDVKNYIAKHDKEVFLSNQWREMEKSHPHLAIDIFRAVHIKDS